MPTTTQTSSATTTTVASFSTPIPVVPTSRIPIAARPQDARLPRRPMMSRMTSSRTHTRPPSAVSNGYTASEDGANDSDAPSHVSRRASWVKRLSSISVSQQPSRNTSPAQPSPTVSCSNGSVAFSHDGSIAPIVGRPTPPQLPPNKLVKRSSSVQAPRDVNSAHGTGTIRPSFRRPATSHQRSATLQNYHSLLPVTRETPSLEVKPSSASTDSSEAEYAQYTQFFAATSLRGRRLSKRFQAKAAKYKRIFPDEKHQATLVLARAVTTGGEELEESASEAGESVFYESRPSTPLSYTAAVAAPKPGAPQFPKKNQARPRTAASSIDVPEDASRRRRSFSIAADILPFESSAKHQRFAKQAGLKLTRGSSQRVSSDPVIPTMVKRSNTHGELPARRNLTDPSSPKRDTFASAGIAETSNARNGALGGSSMSPLSAPRRAMTVPVQSSGPMPQLEAIASAAPATNQAPPSPSVLAQAGVRASRHSMAPSEQASTLVGSSDNEVRAVGSADEDDADLRSETLYDSLRTGATRSVSGGARGPRIETIFDESPPAKLKVTALRDLLPSGTFGDEPADAIADSHSVAEDDESFSTPVRNTVRPEHRLQEAVSFSRPSSTAVFPTLVPSSPPSMPKPLSLGTLEWDSTVGDDDRSSRWSIDEEEGEDSWVDHAPANHLAAPITLRRSNPRLLSSAPNTKPSTPNLALDHSDRDARSSIFDWSEQQVAGSSGNRTPPRPRTVHGKKDANRRDSRSVGRRVPSGLHARSQSVPVVPDVINKRNTVVTNKFGTWGIGSKGVTEDWNDDFDFSELAEEHTPKSVAGSQRIDSGSAMVVPKSIQEQQNNVLANISLLREWGLLIEELKEQRIRAISLGIVEGPQSGMWEEVDAMIDLADQEAEHGEVPHASPPSSPGFDEDAFDDVSASPNVGRARRKSGSPNDDLSKVQTVRPRKSILPPNDRIFGPQTSPKQPKPRSEAPATPEPKPIITRPRKDSEAKARSVIEALQTKRSVFESPANAPPTPSPKKVPFDTATLRRIVPYVNTLTRKVKDSIRDAEGLYYSPATSPQHEEAPFVMSPFQQDADLASLASHMKLMTVM
ncbi:hypothetical protein E8E13_003988 [Curvularia kusanoi]|uniref:Uncharacterized protein n=1 Tax=Curvularia kusanoi TaxID=90978 RepID=A0A9P4W4P2_CURKU|nr:hypothetical protein E8E13_003988 [Curvularia kusanoi]